MGRIIHAALAALLGAAGPGAAQEGEPEAQLYATAAEESAPTAAARHTVSQGDTLWDISNRYYGDPFQWGSLYGANTDKVRDPDRISPGQEIVVPDLSGTAPGG
ncbi:MAG TPA: LysM peptidoglycan-binding domain-containing protein, partial [Elusimicrobiales bacterium]|nr:LysM peptidoglycan-binding domain-containing protein [Elusimicrobiales bacterium]